MTRTGTGALLMGVLFAIAGWLMVWTAVSLIGVAVVLLVVFSLAYVVRRPKLSIVRQVQPPRVVKGLPAIAYLQLHNASRSTLMPTLAVQPYGTLSVRTLLPKLLSGQTGMRTYRLPTVRRGVFPIGPIEVVRSDPFGFFRMVQRHGGHDEIWVTPRIVALHALPSGVTRHLEGPTSDMAQQGSITFHRLREYVVGDDLRMIHWKSTAKTGRLVIRHNVDTSQPFTVVVTDLRPSVYSAETFETAIDIAASVVTVATRGNCPVQLRTSAGEQVGGSRSSEPLAAIDFLTAAVPDPSGSLLADLLALRRQRGGTALVVITGTLDPDVLPAVSALRRRFQRLVVVSLTPVPMSPPTHPAVTVLCATDADQLCAAWNLEVAR